VSEQPGVQPDAQPDAPPDAQPDAQPDVPAGADPRVAAAVERLDGLGDVPVAEHVEVYEDVHQVLQESLAEAQDDGADR
jgi:hypothetical protein